MEQGLRSACSVLIDSADFLFKNQRNTGLILYLSYQESYTFPMYIHHIL